MVKMFRNHERNILKFLKTRLANLKSKSKNRNQKILNLLNQIKNKCMNMKCRDSTDSIIGLEMF